MLLLAAIIALSGSGCSGNGAAQPSAVDADADRIINAQDNCPLSGNPDQTDANRNGLGDACDEPFGDQFAHTAPEGVVEAAFDARRRITRVVGPDWSAELTWSQDAGHVDISAGEHGTSRSFGLDLDLDDTSLLAGLELLSLEGGPDTSFLRQWITEHPGQVQATAAGQVAGRTIGSAAGGSVAGKPLGRQQQEAQAVQPSVEEYLFGLCVSTALLNDTVQKMDELRNSLQPSDPPELLLVLVDLAVDFEILRDRLADYTSQQDEVCVPCTLACAAACAGPGAGACCPGDGSLCFESDQTTCRGGGGRFQAGFSCGEVDCNPGLWGACVVQVGLVTTCSEQREIDCGALDGTPHAHRSCSALPTPGGACTYQTPQGHTTCADSLPEFCDLLNGTFEAGVFCASGACFYDAGGAPMCVHDSPVDCNGLGGDFYADWLCLGYTSAP